MKPLSWVSVVVPAAGGLLAGAALTGALLKLAYAPPLVTPWLALLFALIAAGVLRAGLAVRKLKRRQSTRISPVDAARIALFARASVTTGALFGGFLAGILVVSLFRTWAPATASAAFGAGISLAGAVVLTVIGWLVESWCIDDSADGEGGQGSQERRRRGQEPGSTASARTAAESSGRGQ